MLFVRINVFRMWSKNWQELRADRPRRVPLLVGIAHSLFHSGEGERAPVMRQLNVGIELGPHFILRGLRLRLPAGMRTKNDCERKQSNAGLQYVHPACIKIPFTISRFVTSPSPLLMAIGGFLFNIPYTSHSRLATE